MQVLICLACFIIKALAYFSSRRAVLLSTGTQVSGGYSMVAETVEDYGDYIKLKVLITADGAHCSGIAMLNTPYQFIEIESVKELVIEEILTDKCDLIR